MNKMVRQQLFITAEQKRRIEDARGTDWSVGGRDHPPRHRSRAGAGGETAEGDWKDAWRQAFGMWKDRDDIEEFYAERRKRDTQRMERIRKQMRGK